MILLAVSGGVDSMYMAYKAIGQSQSFAVAHCNFGLRGEESDGDEAFVRQWCAERGVECFVKRFDTAGYASEHGVSIEMAARELRYGWFAELCAGHGFDALWVAHNANDNAETLILNLLRGTGSRGLRGMSPERLFNGETSIVRPLLGTPRQEIEAWMKERGYAWREDRTNSESDYKRNRIRNEVFPQFALINPSFLQTLARDMEHFSQVDDIADDYYGKALEKVLTSGPDAGFPAVSVPALLELKHWKYVLWRVLEPYCLSRETFGKLTELLESGRTISGKVFQGPDHLVFIKKKTISVCIRTD